MDGFTPGLLDRLMGEAGRGLSRLTVEQMKDIVARDLESLLNTRVTPHQYEKHPHAFGSVLNYGLADFAAMCLTSSEDRAAICASIRSAIEAHEPRLSEVSIALEPHGGETNRLRIVINAKLQVGPAGEIANFNAVLQPSSLRYAVSRSARLRANQPSSSSMSLRKGGV